MRTFLTVLAAAAVPVAPWLPERPPQESPRPLAPPCRAGDLGARLQLQGATGSLIGGVDLENVGPAPCSLLGRPVARLVGGGTTVARIHVRPAPSSVEPGDLLAPPRSRLRALRPGELAFVRVWWSNWCTFGTAYPATDPPPARLELVLPRGTIRLPTRDAPRCDAPDQPSRLSIGPFDPRTVEPAHVRLPLAAEIAPKTLRVPAGGVLGYRVVVTNRSSRPFRFGRR